MQPKDKNITAHNLHTNNFKCPLTFAFVVWEENVLNLPGLMVVQ